MTTSEDYLKEHNIKSVSMITESTMAPSLLIKIDNQVLRVQVPQGSALNVSYIDRMIENTVYEYEWRKKIKERKPKLYKILRKSKKWSDEEEI
jgi:hypothetical protein